MGTTIESTLDRWARRQRTRERMATQDLDALLLTGGPNLSYFTGVSGMLGANSGSRPLLYLLPLDGAPVLVVHEFLTDELDEAAADARIQSYEELSSLPDRSLRDALESLELTDGRIGAELGPETTLSVPAGEAVDFAESLPDAEFVDAQPLLVDLRSRKSPAEVERIERACEITAKAYERTFRDIEGGATGAEVESLVCRHMLDCGGSSPWALVTTGRDNYDRTASGGDEYQTSEGDMIWIDGGCAVDGYWSDYSRAGVVVGPTDRQRTAQRAIHEITRNAVEAIEPGVSIASHAVETEAAVGSLDLPIRTYLSRQAGRIGHSLGLQVTELPSLNGDAEGTFRPGMVVTIEPGFSTEYGTFHVEENVLVTENGTRTLSSDRWRLRSI